MSDKSLEQYQSKETKEIKKVDTDTELTTLALDILKKNTEMINNSHDALAEQLSRLPPAEQQAIVDTFASPDLAQQIKERQAKAKQDGKQYNFTHADLKSCLVDFFAEYTKACIAKDAPNTSSADKTKRNTLQLTMLFLLPGPIKDELNRYAEWLYKRMNEPQSKEIFAFDDTKSPQETKKTKTVQNSPRDKVSGSSYNVDTTKIKVGDFSYNNVINVAKQYEGKPYVWGGASRKKRGVDCSGMRCAVFGDLAGKPFPRHTALSFYNKSKKISLSSQNLQSTFTPGTFMFWKDMPGGRKRHSSIYHIEMVTSQPYKKNGSWYVKTYGSSSERLPNGRTGVGERERKIEDPNINTDSRTDMKHLFGTIV